MTKKINLEDIITLVVINIILPALVFGFVTCCIFMTVGIIGAIIAIIVFAFLIGFMFGMELINMI